MGSTIDTPSYDRRMDLRVIEKAMWEVQPFSLGDEERDDDRHVLVRPECAMLG